MKIALFTHSLRSCWNHGNAHFLRGVLTALADLGHEVEAWEPAQGWSVANLVRDHGVEGLAASHAAWPTLTVNTWTGPHDLDLDRAVGASDLVIVHEWTEPWLVAALGQRRLTGRFTLLFHDTHHRAASDPTAIDALNLGAYDGVLAFGRSVAQLWAARGWGNRAFVWHEAADTTLFRPPPESVPRDGLVFIGNWGDEERNGELVDFLLEPAAQSGMRLDIHGVRYPQSALDMLARTGARYRGWLPNARVPEAFARYVATVHVPRRLYVEQLPGIPTIRVFEALACGIPLLSAPWDDCEALFRPGRDFLLARTPADMTRYMRAVASDAELRATLASNGLESIRARHTCAHRARELLAIVHEIAGRTEAVACA